MLSGWKDTKKGKGQVDTWLHTKCLPLTVWRHPFPMIIVVEDKKTRTKVAHVWSRNQTCHETEDVLGKMYWRETKGDPTSARTAPPERCGMCKFAEWCWQQCWLWLSLHRWAAEKTEDGEETAAGKWVLNKAGKAAKEAGKPLGLDPCSVLFKFTSEADSSENTTLHVGGFCGLFGRKDEDMPADLSKAMLAHKIRASEAWKENCMVKARSVMCVVDNDAPEKGVQISEETKDIGEKVKEEITKVWEGSEIDIQKRPYCIRWNYDRSKGMSKQYWASAMMKIKPDPRILKAIRGEAPDLSNIKEPFNQQSMRAIFERHCKVEGVPWDDLFPSREQEKKWSAEDEAEAKKARRPVADDDEDEAPEEDDAEEEDEDSEDEEEDSDDEDEDDEDVETDDEGEELVKCDSCGKPHKISAAKCPHCGHKYDVEEEPEDEEEEDKPRVRTRAEAKAAAKKKASAKVPPNKASAKKSAKSKRDEEEEDDSDSDDEDDDEDDEDDDNQGDEIPF